MNRYLSLSLLLVMATATGCQSLQEKRIDQVSRLQQLAHSQAREKLQRDLQRHFSNKARRQLLSQVQSLLEQPAGRGREGHDQASRSYWQFRVSRIHWQGRGVSRLGYQVLELNQLMAFVDIPARSNNRLNIRAAPDDRAALTGRLQPGERFNVIARVVEQPWVLVEQGEVLCGFVHQNYVSTLEAEMATDLLSVPPLLVLVAERRDLLSHLTHASGPDIPLMEDADGTMPATVMRTLFAIDTCRLLNYRFWQDDQQVSGELEVCRKHPGVWFIAGGAQESLP